MNNDNRRLIFVDSGRWCKHNVCQSVALLAAYPNLGARELALLDYIISWSEREKVLNKEEIDLALSYEDVLYIFDIPAHNKNAAVRILQNLCKVGLISKVNANNRQGRSKFSYLPNTTKIRKAIAKHLQRNDIDKEP